jgi:Ca2+-binding RTX toxin-like protein
VRLPPGNRWKLSLLLALGLTALWVPGSVGAAGGSCSGTGTTLQVKPTPGESAWMFVSGSVIMYTEGSGEPVPCMLGDAAATTTNTDTIHVHPGARTFVLDERGGMFAPGATPEPTGLSEIEFELEAPVASLAVIGTTAANTIAIGSSGIAVNNDADADVTFSGPMTRISVSGGPNADLLTGQGGFGTGSPTTIDLSLDGQRADFESDTGDTINGGNGNDSIQGGPGDDTIRGFGGDDFLSDSIGNDVVYGGDGADLLAEGSGADVLFGDGGVDTVYYGDARRNPVFVSLDGLANDGEAGEGDNVGVDVENVSGGSGDDTIIGSALPNRLIGGGGTDTIQGLGGDDVLDGDHLDGGPGADTMSGFGQSDVVDYSGRTQPVNVTLDGVANDGEAGEGDNVQPNVENVLGGSGNDTLVGSANANMLVGGAGNDTITGQGGSDTLRGGGGNDTFFARDGVKDRVRGDKGTDSAQIDAGLDVTNSIEIVLP